MAPFPPRKSSILEGVFGSSTRRCAPLQAASETAPHPLHHALLVMGWTDARTPSTPSASACSGRNTLLQGLRPAVTLAQWFSLLPVAKPSDEKEASFRWRSLRVAFAFLVILGSCIESVLSLLRLFETGITFVTSVNVMFYTASMITSVVFIKMSMSWREMFTLWSRVESHLASCNGEPSRLVHNMVAATAVVLVLATVEHVLSIVSTIVLAWPCYDRGGLYLLIEGYYLMKYRKTFTTVSFSMLRALLLLALQITTTFIWNFSDLFIILLSMALSAMLRQLNRTLAHAGDKAHLEEFWRQKREAYNALAILTRTMSDYVGPVVLISYASNLYFICLQLLIATKRRAGTSPVHDIYFFFSFFYLVGRTFVMSLIAADVGLESQRPKPILFSVPPTSYSREVRRFIMQVNADTVALTGCNFFSISRSFILTVAGTIVTYMVILVQFDKEAADGTPEETNVTACTCRDLKIYDC